MAHAQPEHHEVRRLSNKGSSSVISLPKGRGAQHGISEKFSPDLHTGTGNFTVPIALPSGRNGFQPQLNLVYSTGNGNGVFGLGWSLSIPGVSRKTSNGVPRYDDKKDTFILSGAEDLVQVEPLQKEQTDTTITTRTRYQPRTEGLFARIKHCRVVHKPTANQSTQVEDYWDARSKDGLVSYYGIPDPTNPDQPDFAILAKIHLPFI
jgi:virulence plasmid B protein